MSTIHLFHGLSQNSIEGQAKAPLFMASSYAVAENFSTSGKVVVVSTEAKNFMDFSDDDKPLIDLLKGAGVDIQEVPFFYCEAITHHSRHDGTNVVDLAYLPELHSLVLAKGYKGIKMTDLEYNKKFNTYVLFDTSDCKISDQIPNTVDEELEV